MGLSAVVAATFMSCREDDESTDAGTVQRVVFNVTPNAIYDVDRVSGKTRVVVKDEDPSDTGVNFQFNWSSGDTIGIFPETGTQVAFVTTNQKASSSVTFDGGGWRLKQHSRYAAYYPLQPEFYLDPTNIHFDLTNLVQTGNGMKSSDHPAIMDFLYAPASTSDMLGNLNFSFHHVTSVLHFHIRIPKEGSYKAVRLVTDGDFVTSVNLNCFAQSGSITPLSTAHELTLQLKDVTVSREGDDTYLDIFFPFYPVDLSGKKLRVEVQYESGYVFDTDAKTINFANYAAGTFFNFSESEASFTPIVADYISQADERRALNNPHKGWYHHFYNNSVVGNNLTKYALDQTEQSTVSNHLFPCLDHMYVRLSWADFEPNEGQYDWHWIDDVVATYAPMGYGISVRIACSETGASGQLVEKCVPYASSDATKIPDKDVLNIRHCSYDKNGKRIKSSDKNPTISSSRSYENCYFGTPYWVVKKGAKGTLVRATKDANFSWAPDYDDSVFLDELRKFHDAFVAHCNANPTLRNSLRYVDIGSLGDWGEGHTSFSVGEAIPVDVVKEHFDMYADCYAAIPEVPLVAMENAITYQRQYEPFWQQDVVASNISELMNDAFRNHHFGLRYDSYMVGYYLWLDDASGFNYAIMRPYIFQEAYGLDRLIVHEQDVYADVKSAGNWQGTNGSTKYTLGGRDGRSYQVTSREIFLESMRRTHPSYIGYQAKMSTYLNDNPDFVTEAGNLSGYWLFPLKASLTANTLTVYWLNKGVAPCLYPYELRLHFMSDDGTDHRVDITDSGNCRWKPAPVDMANQLVAHPTEDIPVSAYANDSYLTSEHGVTVETYPYSFPKKALSPGTKVYMELYDPATERSIDVGLKKEFLDTNDGHIYIPIGIL